MVLKPRDRILETAIRLFTSEGIHAVSVNRIVAESDVALMSLYRHFGGKDELVAAAIECWSVRWLDWLGQQMDRRGDDTEARLDGLWQALDQWVSSDDFHGSLTDNAAAELRTAGHPALRVVAEHRMALRQLLEDLAKLAGATDPGHVAERLQLLVDGAVTVAVLDRRPSVTADARALSDAIMAQAAAPGAAGWARSAVGAEDQHQHPRGPDRAKIGAA